MRSQIQAYTAAVAIGVLMASLAHGQGSSKSPQQGVSNEPSPAYTPPAGKQMFYPAFPGELRSVGQEGWVLITCMVNRHGKAYEVAVVDSNGFEALEKSAGTQQMLEVAERSVSLWSRSTRLQSPPVEQPPLILFRENAP